MFSDIVSEKSYDVSENTLAPSPFPLLRKGKGEGGKQQEAARHSDLILTPI